MWDMWNQTSSTPIRTKSLPCIRSVINSNLNPKLAMYGLPSTQGLCTGSQLTFRGNSRLETNSLLHESSLSYCLVSMLNTQKVTDLQRV